MKINSSEAFIFAIWHRTERFSFSFYSWYISYFWEISPNYWIILPFCTQFVLSLTYYGQRNLFITIKQSLFLPRLSSLWASSDTVEHLRTFFVLDTSCIAVRKSNKTKKHKTPIRKLDWYSERCFQLMNTNKIQSKKKWGKKYQ